jgi:hypothetical protein
MIRRALSVGLAFLVGCAGNDKLSVASPGLFGNASTAGKPQVAHAPATEAVALRVVNLGQKIVTANPQMGLRPTFECVGVPQPVLCHTLQKDACVVYVSEGLVARCPSEGQLAALLCEELGRAASEKVAASFPAGRRPDYSPPPSVRIGPDSFGRIGSPDQTELAELARVDEERKRHEVPPTPPAPEKLAAAFLDRAGYATTDLQAVAPLVRAAEQDNTLEKQLTGRR